MISLKHFLGQVQFLIVVFKLLTLQENESTRRVSRIIFPSEYPRCFCNQNICSGTSKEAEKEVEVEVEMEVEVDVELVIEVEV